MSGEKGKEPEHISYLKCVFFYLFSHFLYEFVLVVFSSSKDDSMHLYIHLNIQIVCHWRSTSTSTYRSIPYLKDLPLKNLVEEKDVCLFHYFRFETERNSTAFFQMTCVRFTNSFLNCELISKTNLLGIFLLLSYYCKQAMILIENGRVKGI